jgi:ribosomal protein S18 acetylase RimI-like enzyme
MKHLFRKIEPRDVDQLFIVRTSVHENAVTLEELASMGITPRSVSDSLGDPLAGYLCAISERIVGFAMADLQSGELSVIAVLSEYERRGLGRELLRLTEELLWMAGHPSIWLWTDTDRNTRALRLYFSAGWIETEVRGPRIYLKKNRPNQAPESAAASGRGSL